MIELKERTAKGRKIVDMGARCLYSSLSEVYKTWSTAKAEAFKWCLDEYNKCENARAFGIGNANTFGFVASWLYTKDGHDYMRVETKDNSYNVLLDL